MRYLLDTNVISELVARHPDPTVVTWIEALDPTAVYLSVITIGEICRGIERLPQSSKRDRLQAWMTDDLLVKFGDRIVPIDVGVMLAWGSLVARHQRGPSTRSDGFADCGTGDPPWLQFGNAE